MRPIGIPNNPTREAWETFAQSSIAQAMAPRGDDDRGLTPIEAAPSVFRQLQSLFVAKFGDAEEFPLELSDSSASSFNGDRIEPFTQPGGVGQRGTLHWFVASMARDKNGVTLGFDVRQDLLRRIAASYDPARRRASVILPSGGPSHFTGEFDKYIPAKVVACQFDGYFFWILAEERFEGALNWAAIEGAHDRSISWFESLPEVGDEPYLIHCALLTGEQPAIDNMIRLDEFFAIDEGSSQERVAATLGSLAIRSLSVNVTEGAVEMTPEEQAAADAAAEAEAARLAAEESDAQRTLSQIVHDGVTRALSTLGVGSTSNDDEDAPEEAASTGGAPAVSAEGIGALVLAGVTPIAEAVQGLTTQVETALSSTAASATEARRTRIAAALDALVMQRRLAPAMRPVFERQLALDGITDAEVDATLEELSRQPARVASTVEYEVPRADESDPITYSAAPRHLSLPPEVGISVRDPRTLATERTIRQRVAASDGTPEEKRALMTREILGAFGGQQDRDADAPPFGAN